MKICDLSSQVTTDIVRFLSGGKSTSTILKLLMGQQRTILKYSADSQQVRQNGRVGKIRLFRLLRIVMKTKKITTSAAIFEEAGLPNVSKQPQIGS